MRDAKLALVAVLWIGSMTASAWGDYAYVGSGDKRAKVLVEFSDTAVFAFRVSFSDPNTTGIGLLDIIEADTTLTTDRTYYEGLGWMINGISYQGHGDAGYGGGDLWWHYWVLDPPAEWESPWDYGAPGRIATDGCADGWIYGRGGAPRLPGDANGNLVVDAADLALMGGGWLKTGQTWAEGDFNDDGIVNAGDLALMGGNWLFGAPGGGVPLPEPATVSLLAGMAPLLRRRRAG